MDHLVYPATCKLLLSRFPHFEPSDFVQGGQLPGDGIAVSFKVKSWERGRGWCQEAVPSLLKVTSGVLVSIQERLHKARALVVRQLHGLPQSTVSPHIQWINGRESCSVCIQNRNGFGLLSVSAGEALTPFEVCRLVELILKEQVVIFDLHNAVLELKERH